MKINYDISVLIPVYNEEDSINQLYHELNDSLGHKYNWEVIFINDGSTDTSSRVILDLIKNNKNIRQICLYKNKGKSEALNIAFKHCNGNIIITIDADLQDDPNEIINLINKINSGYDMVSGWKVNRKDPMSKIFPSKIFNMILRFITGIKLHDFNCGLKAYRKEVINTLNIYGGLHRFIPILVKQNGFNIAEVKVNHRQRKFGFSKYGSSRIFHGFFDLITLLFFRKYLSRPLHFFGIFGLIFFMSGLIINLYLSINWFNGFWITPFKNPLFFLGILLIIIGVQFFSIGLIGELIVYYNKYKDTDNDYHIDE